MKARENGETNTEETAVKCNIIMKLMKCNKILYKMHGGWLIFLGIHMALINSKNDVRVGHTLKNTL